MPWQSSIAKIFISFHRTFIEFIRAIVDNDYAMNTKLRSISDNSTPITAHLFITCLVDNLFPTVGESMVKVLRKLGIKVYFPKEQTCCGQPAHNSGYGHDARIVAKRFIEVFEEALKNTPGENAYIVSPSGSCVSMVKVFYKELFKDDPQMLEKLRLISQRTHEFSDFLVNVLDITDVGAKYQGTVTYHDACHMLRELRIKDEPRRLIENVQGLDFKEMEMHDACCGFGGTFAVKFPKVSVSMLDEKIDCLLASGADTLVSSDSGCLMNIDGALSKRNIQMKVMHLAELLAQS